MNKKLVCLFLMVTSFNIPCMQARNDVHQNIFPIEPFIQDQIPFSPQEQPFKRIRQKFSPEEDEQLKELVKQYGTKSWALVSSLMKGRNPRQCRERWKHYLSVPSVPDKKIVWTDEEDEIIMNAFQELGRKWTKIAAKVQGKSDLAVKNRINTLLKRNPYYYSSSQKDAAASTTLSVALPAVSGNSNTQLPFQLTTPDSVLFQALDRTTNSEEKELTGLINSIFHDLEF